MKKSYLVNGLSVLASALGYILFRRRVPVMVSLGLTSRCNLNCPFCYAKDPERGTDDYDTARVLNYVDQFVRLGTRIFLLQGGEPLLRRDLREIIAHIKGRGRFCRISTNGVLVADRIDDLRGIDFISFSLDGNEEVCDAIRGKGVYRKVVAGIEAAHSRGIPFEIHASLIRKSASDKESIRHLLELARKYNAYVSFCITCVSGAENTRDVGSGDLTSGEVKEFYRFLIGLKKNGYPVSNSFNSLRKTLDWPIAYSEIGMPGNLPAGFKFVPCRHGRLICWLDAKGRLYPCPITFLRPEFSVSIVDHDIARAWKELGKKVPCAACGGSDESTTLLALQFEDLKEAFLRAARGFRK